MTILESLAASILRHTPGDGMHASALPNVTLIRSDHPTTPLPTVYAASLCIVAQGRKQVMWGDRAYVYDAARYLVVAVDMPLTGAVVTASPHAPYLCLQLDLDMAALGEIVLRQGPAPDGGPVPGLALDPVPPPLVDAACRLVDLLDTPQDIAALAPLIEREILYRLATGATAAMIRHIATGEHRPAQVARAIAWVKRHFAEDFSIDDLAAEAGMSASSLHAHSRR